MSIRLVMDEIKVFLFNLQKICRRVPTVKLPPIVGDSCQHLRILAKNEDPPPGEPGKHCTGFRWSQKNAQSGSDKKVKSPKLENHPT